MKSKMYALLLTLWVGLTAAGILLVYQPVKPAMVTAWWGLLYEIPNPEHLPVKVEMKCLKLLE